MCSKEKPSPRVPVARPQLPDCRSLIPYLQLIDENRIYSNFGPLQSQLAQRLQAQILRHDGHVLTCSSGTSALIAAISAVQTRWAVQGPLCLLPGHSFVATAAAAEFCGFRNVFVDVDPQTWSLDPVALQNHPKIDQAGLVLVVAPYGRAIDMRTWQAFQDTTGVPVVIDIAAGFETFANHKADLPETIPIMMSLHATKSFSSGEGGLVLTRDLEILAHATCSINHGFLGSRHAKIRGQNGKMSEYHAAVGLAELDGWQEKTARMQKVSDGYRRVWKSAGIPGKLWSAPNVSGCYILLEAVSKQQALDCLVALDRSGIDARFWYGQGLHKERAFRHGDAPQVLPITEDLCARIIGLPCFVDMGANDIARVIEAIRTSSP